MKALLPRSQSSTAWLLIIPTVAWYYIGLFLTMLLWYPAGLSSGDWQRHLLHFSVIYILWVIVFFSYRLFDLEILRTLQTVFSRLAAVLVICLVIAVLYFYFQPELLITPRRFLLVHMVISGFGIALWYVFMQLILPRSRRRVVFVHPKLQHEPTVESLVESHRYLGLQFGGLIFSRSEEMFTVGAIVVMPAHADISGEEAKDLFALRDQGVSFIEYHDLFERLTRTVHLSVLNDLWFVHSINYGSHGLFDAIKRGVDVVVGLVGSIVWLATFPVFALAIKLNSRGPVLFKQPRVGLRGRVFTLYKYRTMVGGDHADWHEAGDTRITRVGKWLRKLRIDELPQFINILKGDMSLVGPRPEQVHFVEQLREQIPYYDERHIVKPGLTGWAQLHIYAGSLEETRQKLQYDLYYIKHRSLLFDLEIILKTAYNMISFSGR